MSRDTYNELWRNTQKQLEILAITDFEQQTQELSFDRSQSQNSTYELYLRYIRIANKLERVYDKMIQPQKRILVRKLLDSCYGRVIELKHDLVHIDMMEFSYNDAIMEKLKITPLDTELRIPRYFIREREKEIRERKQTMDEILIKLGWMDDHPEEQRLTEVEAIRMLQMHERARQGRLRYDKYLEIRKRTM